MRRILSAFLALLMLLSLSACADASADGSGDVPAQSTPLPTQPVPLKEDEKPAAAKIEKTAVQAQKPWYLPIGEVGAYNPKIITDEIIDGCTLEELSADTLPCWNGLILENKISITDEPDGRWDAYTPGSRYWTEDQIRFQAEQGFNCVRVLYSFSFLSNPEDINSINMAELEQLDELLSWCMKYNVHMMLSVVGLPGMAGHSREDENVNRNGAAFTDPAMGEAVTAYWNMISRRYADIPSGALSFEVLAEMIVPGENLEELSQRFLALMEPIVRQMQADAPGRIIIIYYDLLMECEELLEMGCCISNHLHLEAVGRQNWTNMGIGLRETHWPLDYLPGALVLPENGELKLQAESAFSAGEFRAYVQYWDASPAVICTDGTPQEVTVTENEHGVFTWSVPVPEGTKEITMASHWGFVNIWMVELAQEGKEPVQIASHHPGSDQVDEIFPTIVVKDDGTLSYPNGETVDAEYVWQTRLKGYLDLAEKYHVSFLATEVGTDTTSLTPEEYIACHEMWLKLYQEHHVGWMYNCERNIFAPKELMWLNGETNPIPFEHFSQWEDGPYWINDDVLELLKAYTTASVAEN